jgi:hypothetical protein
MEDSRNRALVQGLYEAFGRGDIEAVLAGLADDVTWNYHGPSVVPTSGSCSGREAVGAWFGVLAAAAEFEAFTPGSLFAQGDHVVVLGQESCRARSTGRSFTAAWVHVFQFKDGLVTAFDEYTDAGVLEKAFRTDV